MGASISRRRWLRAAALGAVGAGQASWFRALAEDAGPAVRGRKACILLWMNGGPSQLDTLDPKPGHANAGPLQSIATTVPGLRVSETLPRLARRMGDVALLRTMSTREGDHARASYLVRTGYLPQGGLQHPTLGALLSKALGADDAALPNFVSVAPYRQIQPAAYGPGFLGPRHAPLVVAEATFGAAAPTSYSDVLRVPDLEGSPDQRLRIGSRLELLDEMQEDFVRDRPDLPAASQAAAVRRAVRLMASDARRAFDLDDGPLALRDAYGPTLFGQGCLLARRLVERGVPFVEVTLGAVQGNAFGWDTHANNFASVRNLCATLDPAWAALLSDLKDRGLLESTLVVWMGEFGRTPRINAAGGRDHFADGWSAALAGCGVRGGQAFGATTEGGTAIDGPRTVSAADLVATLCVALGLDPRSQNLADNGRPIRLADVQAQPVREVLA